MNHFKIINPKRNRNCLKYLKKIHFEKGSHELTKDAKVTLRENAQWLSENPWCNVILEGHCDEKEVKEFTQLGKKRAEAAKKYLIKLGLNSRRFEIIDYGKEKPLDPGHNEKARAKNRRVEFCIKKETENCEKNDECDNNNEKCSYDEGCGNVNDDVCLPFKEACGKEDNGGNCGERPCKRDSDDDCNIDEICLRNDDCNIDEICLSNDDCNIDEICLSNDDCNIYDICVFDGGGCEPKDEKYKKKFRRGQNV
jgi:hypothetical protein